SESNRRPFPYHGNALPTELRGPAHRCGERPRERLHVRGRGQEIGSVASAGDVVTSAARYGRSCSGTLVGRRGVASTKTCADVARATSSPSLPRTRAHSHRTLERPTCRARSPAWKVSG